MAEVDVVAEQEDKEEFAHIFLLLVAIESFVSLEFGPNVGQFFVDSFHFRFFTFAVADIGNEDGQAAHSITFYRGHDAVDDDGENGKGAMEVANKMFLMNG